jgi:transposase
MKRSSKTKASERMTVDRKIIEGLASGHSLTALSKSCVKSKDYVIKIRDLGLEHGFITPSIIANKPHVFMTGPIAMPPYPEALFVFNDGRTNRQSETDRLLKEKREWIKERLEVGWSRQTVFEEIGVAVARTNFYRHIDKQNFMASPVCKNVIELIHRPGECLQVDWGKLFDVIDPVTNKKKTVWIFIGILGHSRFEMARVVEKLDFRTTIELLTSMFEELGGCPEKLTTDNPKVFTKKADDYEPEINPAFERFASAYRFTIEALPPADPKKKGKVERMVPVKRRLFESFDLATYTLEKAQKHLGRKLEIMNERKHGSHGLRPIDVFIDDEAAKLKSLPALRYEPETITTSTVRDDGYVLCDKKYYRVDPRLKKQIATVIANSSLVSIYVSGRLLEVYPRITDPFRKKDCKPHYQEPWEKTLQDHGHYLKRAAEIGPDVERFVSVVLARGEGFVDTRIVWGILTLNKTYTDFDVNKACSGALELSQVSMKCVRQLLSLTAVPKKKRAATSGVGSVGEGLSASNDESKGGKFARPMSDYKKHLNLVHSKP